jgi:predicted phosphodiesterase
MRIRVFSDLHLEFSDHKFDHIWTPSEEDKDTVLLLAGDIDVGRSSGEFMEELCRHFKYVLRICGNHEFYNHEFDTVLQFWRDFEVMGPHNFHFLNSDKRVIDGVRFLGGTMWTGFNKADPVTMVHAQQGMNDYHTIKRGGKFLSPYYILEQHKEFMNFLNKELETPFDGPTVVMTHHSPGNHLKRRGCPAFGTDHCYFADLEELIGNTDIKLWVHGHTHEQWDYMINETRVVCNPYGYHNYRTNPDFDKVIMLEV